ncbi:EpsG family protein [Pseudoalteromonas fuliginea]|nr:EpsG family protein [Pseudoalteromonas fuliginea]
MYIEAIKINGTRVLSLNCKNALVFIIITFLCFISATRSYTGQDFAEYIDIYNYTPAIFSGEDIFQGYSNIEPGFRVIASVAKMFDSDIVYLALCAGLSLFPLYFGIIKVNRYTRISMSYAILIYFCFFYINYNFNAMRQAITMGFFICSISYMYEKKTSKVILISLLAATFHSTGILILLSYIASRFYLINSYKKIFFVLIASLIAYRVDILTRVFAVSGVNISRWQDLWGEISVSSIILRIILIAVLIFPKPVFKEGRLGALLFTFYIYGFFIYMALGSVDMMAARFNMFFRVLEVLLIPLLLARYRVKINKGAHYLLFFCLYFLVLFVTSSIEVNHYNFLVK